MDLVFAQIYGPSPKPASQKSEQKKWGFVTYSMEWGREVIKICIEYLSSNRERIIIIQFKQTFEFSRPHSEIHPAKLTNYSDVQTEYGTHKFRRFLYQKPPWKFIIIVCDS